MGCNCSKLNQEDSRGLDYGGTNHRLRKKLRQKNRLKRESRTNSRLDSQLLIEINQKAHISNDNGSLLSQYMRELDQMPKKGLMEDQTHKDSSYIQFTSIVQDDNYSSMLLSSKQICDIGLQMNMQNSVQPFDLPQKSQLQIDESPETGTKATENCRDHISLDVNEQNVVMGRKDEGIEQLLTYTDKDVNEAHLNRKELQIDLDAIDPRHFIVETSPSANSSCANATEATSSLAIASDLAAPINFQRNLVDLQDIDEDLVPLSEENKEINDIGYDEELLIGGDDYWVGNESGVAHEDDDNLLLCQSGNDIIEDIDELIEEEDDEQGKPEVDMPNQTSSLVNEIDRKNNTFDIGINSLNMSKKNHSEPNVTNKSLLKAAGHNCKLEQSNLNKSLQAITERNMMSEVTSLNEENGSTMQNSFSQWIKSAC